MSANTSKRNSQLVSCIIYPLGSWDNVVRIKITLSKCYVVHFRRYQQYYMRCMYIFFDLVFTLYFFLQYVVVKQTPVIVFHSTQSAFQEIGVKYLCQGHNDVKSSTIIEPST